MKVILLNGSPNKEGCCNRALKEIASSLEKEGVESQILWLGKDAVSGCLGCGFCRKSGKCVKDKSEAKRS